MLVVAKQDQHPSHHVGCPTNRPSNQSLSDSPPSHRLLDTVRVTGPIKGHCLREVNVKRLIAGTGEFNDRVTSATGFLESGTKILVRTNGGLSATMERSLPNISRGNNVKASTVEEARDALSYIYDEAAHFVEWDCELKDLHVRRADVVGDFDGVLHLDALLNGLARVSVPRCRSTKVYTDPQRGGAKTLSRSVPGSWQASVYDKHAEVLHRARRARTPDRRDYLTHLAGELAGRARFEVSVRTQPLLRAGVITVSDLFTESKLLYLREYYFQRACFDHAVGGAPHLEAVARGLAAAGDPRYSDYFKAISMLKAEAWGLPCPVTSTTTQRKYRALLKDLDVSAADTTNMTGPAVALDLSSGTLRAAS
jgi:hypothetical protein